MLFVSVWLTIGPFLDTTPARFACLLPNACRATGLAPQAPVERQIDLAALRLGRSYEHVALRSNCVLLAVALP